MVSSVGGLYVGLGLDSAEFQAGLKGAGRELQQFSTKAQASTGTLTAAFSGLGKGMQLALGAAGIGALGLGGLIDQVKRTVTQVADLSAEAKKAGVAFEAFQELKYVAEQARVGVDALTDGLKEMQLRADEFIRTGAGSSEEAFKRLGYTAADLKKKLTDPAALFEEIIDKMKRFNKAAQIRIADEVFGGTGGEQFVRLMEQGEGAIGRARMRARELGLVISQDLGKEAEKVARQFDELAQRIDVGLKTGVLQGVQALESYKGEIVAVAAAVGALAAGMTLGPLVSSLSAAAAGAVAAGVQMTRLNATILAVTAAQRAATLAGAGLSGALSLLGGPAGIAIAALVGGITLLALRQSDAKATAETHQKAMSELDKAIADVKGKVPGAEAVLRSMADQHVDNAKKVLADAKAEYEYAQAVAARQKLGGWAGKYGTKAPADNTGELAKSVEDGLKRVQQAQSDLDELQKKREQALATGSPPAADFALPGKGDALVKSAQERVRALEVERNALTMTKEAAAQYTFMMEAEAQARQQNITLTPTQKAQLEALAAQYAKVTTEIEKTKEAQEQLNEIKGAVGSFFSDLRSGLQSGKDAAEAFGDALKNLANKLLDMLQNKLLDQLFKSLPGFGFSGGGSVGGGGGSIGLFAQGGPVRLATGGGPIRGAGSGTSDSIPAMLSNGEYVVRASEAKRFAPLLEAINSGRLRVPHFATGGGVNMASIPRGGGAAGGGVTVNVQNQTGVAANATAQVQRGPNGQQMVNLVLQAVRKDFAVGGFDSSARGRFGLSPSPVRRG